MNGVNAVWRRFDEIRRIPRCTGNYSKIFDYLRNFAEARGLEILQDRIGNVLIRKHCDNPITLQAHMDMVCEKNENVNFDFSKDPIELIRKGKWLMANGTTLGADNGVGMAAALAALDELPCVEALLTVNEETDMSGALNLDLPIRGKYLINLDTEEEGVLYTGCAGGVDTIFNIPIKRESYSGSAFEITVRGFRGGHSGTEIHLHRGNAIKRLAELLDGIDFKLVSIDGGNKPNAIPREARAIVFAERIEDIEADVRPVEAHDYIVNGRRIIDFILSLPHGVLELSTKIKGLVETSTNLASVRTADSVEIVESSRSSSMSALRALERQLKAHGRLVGAKVIQRNEYPGWETDKNSEAIKIAASVYKRLFGKAPKITAIHAGLEVGVIKSKFPNLDVISIGPTIKNAHSPNEMVDMRSVERFWKFLTELVKEMSAEKVRA